MKKKRSLQNTFQKNYIRMLVLATFAGLVMCCVINSINRWNDKTQMIIDGMMCDDYKAMDMTVLDSYEGYGLYVIDTDLQVLRHDGAYFLPDRITRSNLTDFIYEAQRQYGTYVRYNENSGFWLIVKIPMPVKLWIFVEFDLGAGGNLLNVLYVLFLLLLWLAIIYICVLIYSKITSKKWKESLHSLTGITEQIRNGNYDVETSDNPVIEFQHVEEAMTMMSEKIKLENRKKQQLLIDISHDLKNPLMSIIGYARLAEREDNRDKTEGYLEVIQKNGNRAAKLLEDLTELAKRDQLKESMEMKSIDLAEFLRMYLIERYTELDLLHFQCEIDIPEQQIWISGNEKSLVKVLDNIMDNIIKYGKEQLSITLRVNQKAAEVTFENERTGNEDMSSPVKNKMGIGLNPQGTGIGLEIVDKIVTAHGGALINQSNARSFALKVQLPLKI